MAITHAIFNEFTDTLAGQKAREYFGVRGIPNKHIEEFHFTDLSRGLETINSPSDKAIFSKFKADFIIDISQNNIEYIENKFVQIEEIDFIEANRINALLCSGLAKNSKKITISDNSRIKLYFKFHSGARSAFEIEIGKNCEIEIIEEYVSNSGLLSNLITINIDDSSCLNHIMIMDTFGAQVTKAHEFNLRQNSKLNSFALIYGGQIIRNDFIVNLNQINAKTNINAAYMLDGTHNDFTSNIIHNAPNCESHEMVRGIVSKNGHGVFQGLIKVAKGAQKTIGNMEHRAIMLEDGARINAKPCLEIYADDVECSHANTIGALDDKALFYMQSRGISKTKAKSLLTLAFLQEVFDDLEDKELHSSIIKKIENKLGEMIK